jgi:hypothetical protein
MIENPLLRHCWLAYIAGTIALALFIKVRSRTQIRRHPELAGGYQTLFLGTLFLGSLPWFIMGIGLEFGGVPNIISYYRPRDGNPFVLAWFAIVIAYWFLGFYWLFARRGAEFLLQHPGILPDEVKSANMIRLAYCLMVAGGVAGLIMAFTVDFPRSFK